MQPKQSSTFAFHRWQKRPFLAGLLTASAILTAISFIYGKQKSISL